MIRMKIPASATASGRRLVVALGVLVLSLWFPLAAAEDIWVVASQSVSSPKLTRTEVANLFLGLGRKNPALQPYDRSDPDLRERFYREAADLSMSSVRAHWAKQVFTGRGRPPAMLKTEEIEGTLAKHPGAVTYVPAGHVPAGGRIVLILETEERK